MDELMCIMDELMCTLFSHTHCHWCMSHHRLLCDTESVGGGTADDMYVCMYGHHL